MSAIKIRTCSARRSFQKLKTSITVVSIHLGGMEFPKYILLEKFIPNMMFGTNKSISAAKNGCIIVPTLILTTIWYC